MVAVTVLDVQACGDVMTLVHVDAGTHHEQYIITIQMNNVCVRHHISMHCSVTCWRLWMDDLSHMMVR